MNPRILQQFCANVLAISLLAHFSLGHDAQAQENKDALDKDYSSELPRFKPLSPQEALASFQILPGFRIELVAAEPLVVDPIAFAFDARSRLFVIEMRDYSEQDTECLGRVALLTDTDQDGVMDQRSTFAEGLSWPTALYPWRDGVLVAAPPKLTWYRDTNDDGVSDTQEEWLTGFHRTNVQGMVNSLRWGVDGYIHGATSSTGADLDNKVSSAGTKLQLRRTDFAIDPLSQTVIPESGGGQHGLSFNRWGDKFVTSNSDHLQQIVNLETWLRQNRSSIPMPALRKSIALDGRQAEVFRASPIEPWRIVRTRLRVGGLVPGPVEGGGRPAGYFTGATGTWIADAEAGYSKDDQDVALVCDVGSNLLHRKTMTDQGLYWSSDRADKGTELLRSTDTWFRPVQLGDGPDGAIYIADMYREVIEHPKSLPELIKKHLDLTSGRDRGRIWRLIPDSSKSNSANWTPMDSLSDSDLVEQLASPIAWRRRKASQLLVSRDFEDGRALTDFVATSDSPEARILAMHVANRLQLVMPELFLNGLQSKHPRVIEHTVRLIRQNKLGDALNGALLDSLATAMDDRVLLEFALLANELETESKEALLRRLLPKIQHELLRSVLTVVISKSSAQPEQILAELQPEAMSSWLKLLLPIWCDRSEKDKDLQLWLAKQLTDSVANESQIWLDAFSQQDLAKIARIQTNYSHGQKLELRRYVLNRAEQDPSKHPWLRLLGASAQQDWAEESVAPNQPAPRQLAGIDLLASVSHPQTASILTESFPSFSPQVQQHAARVLASRANWTKAMLQALDKGQVKASQIPLDIKQKISGQNDFSKQANTLFGASNDRREVLERYQLALQGFGSQAPTADSIELGKQHFAKVCGQCHRLGEVGNNVGAALKQLSTKTPGQLLEAILDPNREIDPRYMSYSVLVNDSILAGIVESESANQIVLIEAGGKRHTIARSDIDSLKNQGKSLMPVGLEEQLSPKQMTNLIQFLRRQ